MVFQLCAGQLSRNFPSGKRYGGDEGVRTPDLGIANAALSQLSYIPIETPLRGLPYPISRGYVKKLLEYVPMISGKDTQRFCLFVHFPGLVVKPFNLT